MKMLLASLALASTLTSTLTAQVTYERLLNAAKEPQNWLTYSGGYSSHRYTALDEINRANVKNLQPLWTYQKDTTDRFETTPLVADGIMYISEPPSDVTALDAATGATLWRYRRDTPENIPLCCGKVNRGVALLDDSVYIGTIDAHLVALDAKTGLVRWDVEVADYKVGVSMTGAPLAVKDKIVIGMAGGEYGVRGFLDAYDAKTGKRAWRFWTVPDDGEPGTETWAGDSYKRGSATTWVTGSFDPELDLLYWGTGNPGPDWNGDVRKGDNLYSDSLIALDPNTGKLKWHFQFTPHDTHDWDSTEVPVLAEGNVMGQPRKLILFANRNAFYYVLDRTKGQFLLGKAYAKQTWAKGLDDSGRPMTLPNIEPTVEGTKVYPSLGGATNWYSPSYSPKDHLFFVNVAEMGHIYHKGEAIFVPGSLYNGGGTRNIRGEEPYGEIRAFDPETGTMKWEFRAQKPPRAGLLSTAGGLLFGCSAEGDVFALDTADGKPLWHFRSGGRLSGNPMAYAVDGRQRVALTAGQAVYVFGLPD